VAHQLWFCSRHFQPKRDQGENWGVYVKTNHDPRWLSWHKIESLSRYQEPIKKDIAVTISQWSFEEHPDLASVIVGVFQPLTRRPNRSTFVVCPIIGDVGAADGHPEYKIKRITVKEQRPGHDGNSASSDRDGYLDCYEVFRPKRNAKGLISRRQVNPAALTRKRLSELAATVIDDLKQTRKK
jgi:hypothetical protein